MKAVRLILLFFVGFGSIMLTVAAWSFVNTRTFVQRASAGEGVILANVWRNGSNRSSGGAYYPRVRFRTGGGREYVFVSNYGSRRASFRVGERVQVLYSPDSPTTVRISSFGSLWVLPMVFGSIGLVFCSVGLGPILWHRHVRQRDDWLLARGQRIMADFDRVELNTSLCVNGRSPYRIVCQWLDPASDRIHVFRSHNLWYNPQRYITGNNMLVMVDPANHKRYFVDTSFLPELAE